jgi:hypothetical protein
MIVSFLEMSMKTDVLDLENFANCLKTQADSLAPTRREGKLILIASQVGCI